MFNPLGGLSLKAAPHQSALSCPPDTCCQPLTLNPSIAWPEQGHGQQI